jgi:hypothetical protein
MAVIGAALFYIVFEQEILGVAPGDLMFLAALILLPIGSGVLFYGAAVNRPS